MNTIQKVAVIIATTGLVTTLVLPGRKTASVIGAGGKALIGWQKASMGR